MGKRWFETVLSILIDRQRAAEITGDLLEQHATALRFWWAASQVFVSFTWRPVAGVLAAQVSLILSGLSFGNSWHQAGSPMMTNSWQSLSMRATYIGMYAWPVACITAAKFGRRSSTAAAACTLAALVTLVSCSFTTPSFEAIGLAAILLIGLTMLSTSANRASIALIGRGIFSVWLVDTTGTRGYFELLRHVHMPLAQAQRLGALFTLITWLFAVSAGWLALRAPSSRSIDFDPGEQTASA